VGEKRLRVDVVGRRIISFGTAVAVAVGLEVLSFFAREGKG
jgi:hypothetical protein